MAQIVIHDDENLERALKRFKQKGEKAGIISRGDAEISADLALVT